MILTLPKYTMFYSFKWREALFCPSVRRYVGSAFFFRWFPISFFFIFFLDKSSSLSLPTFLIGLDFTLLFSAFLLFDYDVSLPLSFLLFVSSFPFLFSAGFSEAQMFYCSSSQRISICNSSISFAYFHCSGCLLEVTVVDGGGEAGGVAWCNWREKWKR